MQIAIKVSVSQSSTGLVDVVKRTAYVTTFREKLQAHYTRAIDKTKNKFNVCCGICTYSDNLREHYNAFFDTYYFESVFYKYPVTWRYEIMRYLLILPPFKFS